jgi:hypothetical protein
VTGLVPSELGGGRAAGGSRWCDGLVDEELLELGPRRSGLVRWLAILVTVLTVIGITTHAVRRSAVSSPPLAATPRTVGTVSATVPSNGAIALPGVSQRPFPMDTAAVILGEVPQFAALERTDGAAAQGPWSLVVRRRDGSLGRHGAVITYPVPRPAWGHPVRVGRAIGTAVAGGFVWPLAGTYARIRSDLPPIEVVRLALGTTVVRAVPAIHPVSAYRIVVAAPYRSGSIHEIRYHASQLGSGAAGLRGLIDTGLLTAGGGFEDRLYARSATDAGQLHGRPAVATMTIGGNDMVAWEVAPARLPTSATAVPSSARRPSTCCGDWPAAPARCAAVIGKRAARSVPSSATTSDNLRLVNAVERARPPGARSPRASRCSSCAMVARPR